MKLKKIKFSNHKIFKNLEVDFCDVNGEPLDTIVLIGENGAGKTTLLRDVFDSLQIDDRGYNEISDKEAYLNNGACCVTVKTEKNEVGMLHPDGHIGRDLDVNHPKIVYMPTEINFEKLNKVDNTFNFTPDFFNIVDKNMTQNIPSLIATKINQEIFKNRKKIIEEVINEVCEMINKVFECLDLDVKLIGLSENYETKPTFKNSLGKEFDINGLSSGEKQLFLRALSLKFLEVNNSIILIDEPEISLHPNWQKKIIKVYENIGENNQLIIATHSPHILGNIEAKQLRIMKKDNDGIVVINGDDIEETYGQNVESILKVIMGIDNVRNDDVSEKLSKIYKLLESNSFNTDEYKNIFNYLRKYLGDLDKDIMRIRLEESVRRKKANVKDK